MKQTFVLAAFAAAMAALPAQAQPVAADLLPAYEVTTIIASMGMRPVGRPAWMRGRYVVAAIDRHGREVNVVLDARDGQVLAVRPLGRGSFGPPPYATRPAPYDPLDGRAPPPAAGPAVPPADDGEFFDHERQQGSLPPQRPTARTAPPRDPAVTGSVTRSAPAERKEAMGPKDAPPVPRPRPELGKANDPGNKSVPAPAELPAAAKADENKPDAAKDAAKPEAKAEAKAEVKPEANKPETRQQASAPKTVRRDQAKPPAASNTEKPKADVRVIDLSKPKTAPKSEDKPGVAIRF